MQSLIPLLHNMVRCHRGSQMAWYHVSREAQSSSCVTVAGDALLLAPRWSRAIMVSQPGSTRPCSQPSGVHSLFNTAAFERSVKGCTQSYQKRRVRIETAQAYVLAGCPTLFIQLHIRSGLAGIEVQKRRLAP